jgi:hypothetical protein
MPTVSIIPNFSSLPLYLVATGLQTIQFLFFLEFHFSLSLHPNCRNWSLNYSVLILFANAERENSEHEMMHLNMEIIFLVNYYTVHIHFMSMYLQNTWFCASFAAVSSLLKTLLHDRHSD